MNLNFKFWEIGLIKLTVLAGAFFLISVWPALANWVTGVNWVWFLAAFIVFSIKPMITWLKK